MTKAKKQFKYEKETFCREDYGPYARNVTIEGNIVMAGWGYSDTGYAKIEIIGDIRILASELDDPKIIHFDDFVDIFCQGNEKYDPIQEFLTQLGLKYKAVEGYKEWRQR